jgi:predicted PurR-regulated permease PerM
LLAGILVVVFVGISLAQVAYQIPKYADQLGAAIQSVPPGTVDPAMASDLVQAAVKLVPVLLAGVADAAGWALLVFLIFAFMLWEGVALPTRVASAGPVTARMLPRAVAYNAEVRRYLSLTGMLGLLCGGLMAGYLTLVGVDFALLWGVLLAVMSFVPAVGMLIAAVPPIILAFLEHGLGGALLVMAGFVVITNIVTQIMKPQYVGRSLDLSRLVIFLSVIVWGALIGPVGALLAVPLTLFLKMLLASFDETRWLAIVLSNRPAEPDAVEAPAVLLAPDPSLGP